jgi:hypothetical protein
VKTRCLILVLLLVLGACARKKVQPSAPPRFAFASPMMAPGLRCPPVRDAADAGLPDDDRVVGVVVGGKARAYSVKALARFNAHVVNDLVGDVPVTTTYCDKTDCVRTFTDKKKGEPLEISQMGYADGLLLQVGGKGNGYRQATGECMQEGTPPLPAAKLEHTVTTWKAWREKHPQTQVYVGME